jgi:glutathione S-transferase
MTLTLYGSPQSRTMRVLWMLEELGLAFEHRPLASGDPFLKSPAFIALNPAGQIPTLVDDGFALPESMAINLYLARRYGRDDPLRLYPDDLEGEAMVWRWCLWGQGHLEPWVARDRALVAIREAGKGSWERLLQADLAVLEGALAAEGGWLVGERFTVADLCLAGVLSPSRTAEAEFAAFPAVSDWLGRCYGRPAAQAVRLRYAV